MTLSGSRKPEAEETLENSFNWVPKVQGHGGRISQAKGQRSRTFLRRRTVSLPAQLNATSGVADFRIGNFFCF